MALPVTITGISTAVAVVGPFKSSAGEFYFFGRDGTTATTLQAYKATAPDTSWASVATNTGLTTAILWLSGYQQGDIIHLAVVDGAAGSVNIKYRTFDMASDSFVTSETVASALNTTGIAAFFRAEIVYRTSDSQPLIVYNGAKAAIMGTDYARLYFARRTGTNTWSAANAIDVGGSVDWREPNAVLGSSSRTHTMYGSGGRISTITSANAVNTAGAGGTSTNKRGVSYDDAGTQRVVMFHQVTAIVPSTADSGDNPTWTAQTGIGTSIQSNVFAAFADNGEVWLVYGKSTDGDLYALKSTDDGATFGAETSIFAGTIASATTNLSMGGQVYLRGSDYVIPYVVNDNGTLKYNEYVVRTSGTVNNVTIDASSATVVTLVRSAGKKVASSSATAETLTRSTGKKVSSTTTPAETLVRSTAKAVDSASATPATVSRHTGKPIASSSDTLATVETSLTFNRTITAAVDTAATIVRQIGKLIVSGPATLASIARAIDRTVTSSSATAATVSRQAGKAVSASSDTAATVDSSRQTLLSITPTADTIATLTRQTAKAIASAPATLAVLVKAMARSVTASAPTSASVTRQTGKAVTASSDTAATVDSIKAVANIIAASVATLASLARSTRKPIASTADTPTTLTRATAKTVTADADTAGTLANQLGKPVSATSDTEATLSRSTEKAVNATATPAAILSRSITNTITASATTLATLTRETGKVIEASVDTLAQVSASIAATVFDVTVNAAVDTLAAVARQARKTVSAAAATQATLSRSTARFIRASVEAGATLRRSTAKAIGSTAGTLASVALGRFQTVAAAVATVPSLVRSIGKGIASFVTTLATVRNTGGRRPRRTLAVPVQPRGGVVSPSLEVRKASVMVKPRRGTTATPSHRVRTKI